MFKYKSLEVQMHQSKTSSKLGLQRHSRSDLDTQV